ncbi:MAG: lipopolysaccharide transport periplasmic protein LptA [Nitrosomonas sp.]|nr:lipopolysaccharide transport periplasmic protein LptA [Nitrosomonas sp.]
MKLFLIVCLVIFFFSGTVVAEQSDRDQPVHLEADRATVEDINRTSNNRVSVFTGNVILTQGTLRISADKVIMKEDDDGFRYATATGNLVSFRQKRDGMDEYIEGWSRRVEYDTKNEKIELFRKARLKRGLDEVQGDYISYDMNSEYFQVIGSNERGVETGPDNRVRVVIQPKNNANRDD